MTIGMSWNDVRRFENALSVALYDVLLEKEYGPVKVYFDADVLINVIMGAEGRQGVPTEDDLRLFLVRSLLALGYLGPAHVTEAHAFEFVEVLRSQRASNIRSESKDERRSDVRRIQMQSFLQEWGLDHTIRDLKNCLPVGRSHDSIDAFIDKFLAFGVQTFVGLEMADGPWDHRYKVLSEVGLLVDERSGINVRSVLRKPFVRTLNDLLGGVRDRRRSINNLRDALAIGILHEFVGQLANKQDVTIIRFYTETRALWKLLSENEELRRSISYQPMSVGEIPQQSTTARCILRDADYFIMRVSFQALHFRESQVAPSSEQMVSLEKLQEVHRELQVILRDSKQDPAFLEQTLLGERPLAYYVDRFARLALLDSCLDRCSVPRLVEAVLPEAKTVLSFAHRPSTRARVRHNFESVRRGLQENAERVLAWQEHLGAIGRAAEAAKRDLKNAEFTQEFDPLRDLGLIRWGVALAQESRAELSSRLRALLGLVGDHSTFAVADLAALLVDGVSSQAELIVASSILWFLGLLDPLRELLEREERKIDLPAELIVMKTAAAIRGNHQLTVSEKQRMIQGLRQIVSEGADDELKRYSLGMGYVLFHAWHSEQRVYEQTRQLSAAQKKIVQEWANESFACGRTAVSLFKHRSLAWAFGINHCAYVGTCAGIHPEETNKAIAELIMMSDTGALWHYRFADTHAWHVFKRAEKIWAEAVNAKDRSGLEQRKKEVCEMLLRAKAEYTVLARLNVFGDTEPAEHRRQVDLLRDEMGCGVPDTEASFKSAKMQLGRQFDVY